jgi:mono/diheme cytochrome c family protein
MKNNLLNIAVASVILFSSCGKKDPNSAGVEFMPDMYRGKAFEAYIPYTVDAGNGMKDTLLSSRLPAEGTVTREYTPYLYPNTTNGYEEAGLYLKNPMAYNATLEAEGKEIYTKFCVHCHGDAGLGDGLVGQKLSGMIAYNDATHKNLPEGKMYHSITYGKGVMGSHASQLSPDERWKVIFYVQKLQGPKDVLTAKVDSTKK